jgi:hypothetical protein
MEERIKRFNRLSNTTLDLAFAAKRSQAALLARLFGVRIISKLNGDG